MARRLRDNRRQAACGLLGVCALVLPGCGEPRTASAPARPPDVVTAAAAPSPVAVERPVGREEVTGVVTMDGVPLTAATVIFSPVETGTAAFGETDFEGRYRLGFSKTEPGVEPGRYRVRISTAGRLTSEGFLSIETVPASYNENSTLQREVRPGQPSIDFALRSDADLDGRERRRLENRGRRWLNIVLIVADGLGIDWLGCYGGDRGATPHIDALAAAGLRFETVYSMPHPTSARVTLLTGRYPFHHGWVGEWQVRQMTHGGWFDWHAHRSLARRLGDANFSTCIAGQWGLNSVQTQPDALLQHGFTRWCVWPGEDVDTPASRERHWNPYLYLDRPVTTESDGWPDANVRHHDWGHAGTFTGKYGPDVSGVFALNYMARRSMRRQFLFYPMTLPGPPVSTTPAAPDADSESERQEALVRYADAQVGHMVNWLKERGQWQRTIVIFTSDGGRPQPTEHGLLSDRRIRAPLIVWHPQLASPGTVSDRLADLTDLAPTVCDLAGLARQPDDQFDGRSFAPLLLGEEQNDPREWIAATGGDLVFDGGRVRAAQPYAERVIRDQRYKVHVTRERTIDALFDLVNDPAEERNLIGSSAAEHLQALAKFQRVLATFPERDAELQCSPLPDQAHPATLAAPAVPDNGAGGG